MDVAVGLIFRAKHYAVCGHNLFVFQEQYVTYLDVLELHLNYLHVLAEFLTLDGVNPCVRLVADVVGYSFFCDAENYNETEHQNDNVWLVDRDLGEKIADANTEPNNIAKFCKLQKKR